MLHAISKNKTNLYRRYLGHRGPDDGRVMEEDEITSLIMSPLSFLSNEAVVKFWRRLIPEDCITFPSGACSRTQMKFWESRSPNGRRIEPDIFIELFWEDGQKTVILVEIKWRSGLSGEDQLHRQWKEFLTSEEREKGCHIFIAQEVSAGIIARAAKDIWGKRLVLVSWGQVAAYMEELSKASGSLGDWAGQAKSVLEKIKIVPFQGFNKFSDYPVGLLEKVSPKVSAPIFWRDMLGFSSISAAYTKYPSDRPIFFDE